MREASFIRLQDTGPEHKEAALRQRIGINRSSSEGDQIFRVDQQEFYSVTGTPFSYWVSHEFRGLFRTLRAFQSGKRSVCSTNPLGDDTRYFRCAWEIDPAKVGRVEGWVHLAKGGEFSRYYSDIHLLSAWDDASQTYRGFRGTSHRPLAKPASVEAFFRPGATYSRRSQRGFSARVLPGECLFHDKGPGIFAPIERLPAVLAVLNSSGFRGLLNLQMAFGSFEVGVVQRTPFPNLGGRDIQDLGILGESAIAIKREPDRNDEISRIFALPALFHCSGISLNESAAIVSAAMNERAQRLAAIESTIDERVFELYRLPEEERKRIWAEVNGTSSSVDEDSEEEDASEDEGEDEEEAVLEDLPARVANLLMWCVGVAFGRWDVRMAWDESLIPELQGPFERLPRVAPGGLVGPDGLPATAERIASEAWLRARPNVITLPEPGGWEGSDHITASEYPIEVAWDGVLVDDEGHPRDLVERVREVLRYVYEERAHAVEEEALSILQGDGGRNPRSLREWFRTQKASALGKSFFDFHIQRYSKSRRKAPIYWRLASSPKGSSEYAVWLYYPRLTDDTLWSVLSEYVHPKQKLEEQRLSELREEKESATGAEARRLEKEIETKVQLVEELAWLESELKAVAERGYAPELDDGVLISAAPLHRVIAWKEPEKTWKKLEKGEYDWAHIALKLWPERVREKCRTEKSLAIAHGLEELLEEK